VQLREELYNQIKETQQELLLCGGSVGHMSHVFDDNDFTFADFEEIIRRSLVGKLNVEDAVTEKMDGQQLSISWIDGKLRAARNKGQIKNWGENSLTVSGIKKKFAGRGELTKAFSKAMDDLNNAIRKLSQAQKDKIFDNGRQWMNIEIMYVPTTNTIPYGVNALVFHGAMIANKGGNYTGVVRDSGRALGGMIKQISQDLQKTFTIQGPQVVSVPKDEDFENQQNYFLTQLGILRNKYNLNNSDKVSKYHEAFWSEKIDSAFYISKVQLPPGLKQNLINRFVRGDKSYTISKSNINDDKVYEVVKKMATEDFDKLFKQNIKPFEKLFFRLATRILKNVQNYISPSPEVSVQKLKKEIGTTLASFKGATDLKQIAKVKVHLDKIKSMGGFDAIVPSEGIVFKYKGKTLKFTGVFASANQLLGIIKYGN
tara:strand:+ start:2678 stop:3961 length:1284 start_codon:yes stop_codon:yes gene_type:complete